MEPIKSYPTQPLPPAYQGALRLPKGMAHPRSYTMSYLPALLAGALTIGGTALYNNYQIDQAFYGAQPIGIRNKDGICYLAACIQMLDAVRHATGELFTTAITAGDDIIGGYARLSTDRELASFCYYSTQVAVDPKAMVDAYVRHNADHYNKHAITECITHPDGTIERTLLCPERPGNGASGVVSAAMGHILDIYGERCALLKHTNPFLLTTRSGQQFSITPYNLSPAQGTAPRRFDPVQSFKKEIKQAPAILILEQDNDSEPHTMPLSFELITRADTMVHTYRLLSAIYCFPVITYREGFCGGHAIAIARYGDTWYHCDNQFVTRMGDDTAINRWIDRQARISYEGKGVAETPFMDHVPSLLCYEKVATRTAR